MGGEPELLATVVVVECREVFDWVVRVRWREASRWAKASNG